MAARLYLDEGLSAQDVALALGEGFSRGAVVSKMRRIGLFKRELIRSEPVERCPPRRAPPVERRLPPQRPPIPLPPLRSIPPTGVPAALADLGCGACRWPIDDPGPGRMHLVLFCAGPAGSQAYCPDHRALTARIPEVPA
jgi:hypothetical protein